MEVGTRGGKFSARSDEMGVEAFQKDHHFELNYAKKGVFYPPKAGLPPLIGGLRYHLSVRIPGKGTPFELNYTEKGRTLPSQK
jgi:hypothetical protein